MDLSTLKKLTIEKGGTFYLVPQDEIENINNHSIQLSSEKKITLGTLIRIHCALMEIKIVELSKKIEIERSHLSRLSKDDFKEKPHQETLQKLGKFFGNDFVDSLKNIGYDF